MNITQVFSTPIWDNDLPDFYKLKQSFLDSVFRFKEKNPLPYNRSVLGNGYQSVTSLTNEIELTPLFEFICQMAMKANFDFQLVDSEVFLTGAWLNINQGRSSSNSIHSHPETYSGVFYLDIPEKSGNLVIVNPGINDMWQGNMIVSKKNKFNADKIKIQPTEGKIYLWPSYVSHYVEPNDHDEARISISFNVISVPVSDIPSTR